VQRRIEVRSRLLDQFRPERVFQFCRRHLFRRPLFDVAQFEGSVADADQPADFQPERFHHAPNLAVLALADADIEPGIRLELTLERRFDRTVMHAVDGDALFQSVERLLRDAAVDAHAVTPQPSGGRQFQNAREPAVVGQQQQPFRVHVEAADADQPRQVLRQRAEDCRPPFRVGMRRHQPARLVVAEQPRARTARQRVAIDGNAVARADVERGRGDRLAIDADTPGRNPRLRLAPRSKPRARDHLGDAVALFVTPVFFGHEQHLWYRPPSCKWRSTRRARRRRAARCRSVA
jgi:hypothetical protein